MGDRVILAVDPGNSKCGWAVVSSQEVLDQGICDTQMLVVTLRPLVSRYCPSLIVLGDGTGARRLARAISSEPEFPQIELVDEKNSTLQARNLYFQQNPPKGWRRLMPRGLQTPGCPIDDFAAVILAKKRLEADI